MIMGNLMKRVKGPKKSSLKKLLGRVLLVHDRDTDPPVARVFGVFGVVGRRIGYALNLGKSIARNAFFLNDLASGTQAKHGEVGFVDDLYAQAILVACK